MKPDVVVDAIAHAFAAKPSDDDRCQARAVLSALRHRGLEVVASDSCSPKETQ